MVLAEQIRGLLILTDSALVKIPARQFRLVRGLAVLYMLWDTPGRLTEISNMSLEDVDMAAGAVLVMGKGGRERWMIIGNAAKSVLVDYLLEREKLLPNTNALWVSEHGRAILPNGIFRILKRLGNRAGIPNLHTHRFRPSFAVNVLRARMPGWVLQIVGGWKGIPGTYSRTLGAEDAMDCHREVSPGDRLGRARFTLKGCARMVQTRFDIAWCVVGVVAIWVYEPKSVSH